MEAQGLKSRGSEGKRECVRAAAGLFGQRSRHRSANLNLCGLLTSNPHKFKLSAAQPAHRAPDQLRKPNFELAPTDNYYYKGCGLQVWG